MKKYALIGISVILVGCTLSNTTHTSSSVSSSEVPSPGPIVGYIEVPITNIEDKGHEEDFRGVPSVERTLKQEEEARDMLHEKGKEIDFKLVLPQDSTKKLPQLEGFTQWYSIGQDEYAAGPKKGSQREYLIVKNGQTILSRPMYYGADHPVYSVRMVLDKPAFDFLELHCTDACEEVRPEQVSENIFYDGETFNEKFHLEGSHHLFTYNGRLGFVGKTGGKEYIFYDGKPVTEGFSRIRTHSCCAGIAEFLKVYDNGAVLFVGERGKDEAESIKNRFLAEVELSPQVATTDTTKYTGWKNYHDANLGISVEYPSDQYSTYASDDSITISDHTIPIEGTWMGEKVPEGNGLRMYRTKDSRIVDYLTQYKPFAHGAMINGIDYQQFEFVGLGDVYGYMTQRNGYYYVFESMWGPNNPVSEKIMKSLKFDK